MNASIAITPYNYTSLTQSFFNTLSGYLFFLFADKSLENLASRPRLESLSSVEEDDYDTLTDIESDKNVIRTKVN